MSYKPWIESIRLRPDALKEQATTDIFAVDAPLRLSARRVDMLRFREKR